MTLISGHGFPASVAAKPRSFALALGLSLLAGTGLFWATHADTPHSYSLAMSSMNDPSAIYFSAWNDGPIVADHDASDGKTVVYHRHFTWVDGCTWEAVETLTPVDNLRYGYEYEEKFLSCPAGETPSGVPTPRNGIVVLTRVEQEQAPTPLTGTAHWPE